MAHTIAVVVSEPAAVDCLSKWLVANVLQNSLSDSFDAVLHIEPAIHDGNVPDAGTFAAAAMEKVAEYVRSVSHSLQSAAGLQIASASDSVPPTSVWPLHLVVLVVAVYWDAMAETCRASFVCLKELADEKSARHEEMLSSILASSTSPASAIPPGVEVLVQALNAKKGNHIMQQSQAALVSSLQKKLFTSRLLAQHGWRNSSTALHRSKHVDPSGSEDTSAGAAGADDGDGIGRADISTGALTEAVREGQGECFLVVSADTADALAVRVAELRANCAAITVGCDAVLPDPREVPAKSSGGDGASRPRVVQAQEFLLRRNCPEEHIQMRLAMCGNVDSGKSTITSVLTRGCRDDGRGFARAFVFNHRHEVATGRTSSISENHLGFSSTGEVINYQLGSSAAPARQFTPQELARRSSKVFTLYDLAGHEKYLKTTVLGMTRNMPDYACVVISANNGIQRMTKEHIGLCIALRIPFFVVVTRIDATPENVLKETLASISKLLKIPTVRKLPYPVRSETELIIAAQNLRNDRITPIFEVSNVTGAGVPPVLRFLNLLPTRKDWRKARTLPKEMVIDSTFFVTGVGTVVGGIVTQGCFRVNDTVILGPDGLGNYRPVSIKSIHVKGVDATHAEAGNDAALCLKKERRSAIRKGNVLLDAQLPPSAYWQFEAEVTILYHSTTISTNYEPVIHASTVRQSARITFVAKEILRTGDRSVVHFHFIYRPEYMKEGQRLIFREGRTKGIGVVTKLIAPMNEALLVKCKAKKRLASEHHEGTSS